MLFKAEGKPLIEARDHYEAAKILGTDEFKAYKKPSQKAFMMYCWIMCGKSDAKLMKIMLGSKAPFLDDYYNNPNEVKNALKRENIRLNDWIMLGEKAYDPEKHSEFFYRKENRA